MLNLVWNMDTSVETYINSLRQDSLAALFNIVTHFGSFLAVAIISLAVLYFLWKKERDSIKYFILAMVLNEAVVYLMKTIVGRLRPLGAIRYQEFDFSMPSGHAAISILLYGYICYLVIKYMPKGLGRNIAIAFLPSFVLLLGFSRLYLDVHYLTDVLVGYLIGGTVLFYLIKLSGKTRK